VEYTVSSIGPEKQATLWYTSYSWWSSL